MIAAAVGIGFVLAGAWGERQNGQEITGLTPGDDARVLMTNARQAMNQGDYALANSLFGQVVQMERDQGRDNAEAIAYFGWTLALLSVGDPDAEAVDGSGSMPPNSPSAQAIDMEPDYADPYCFQAIIEFQFREDAAAALPFAEQCQANDPPSEVADLIGAFVDDIRAAAATGLTVNRASIWTGPDPAGVGTVGVDQAGGGQTVAETTRSSLRRRIHTLALRQSGSVLSCIPRRTRAWTVAGITSPWLHNTAPSVHLGEEVEHAFERRILEQAVVGPHDRVDRGGERFERLHAAHVRARHEFADALLRQSLAERVGLLPAGLAQRAIEVVAGPHAPFARLGMPNEVDDRMCHDLSARS